MTQTPAAIDILVTAYDSARFLPQTIDSILKQTFTNWRLLIVDDLSTDRTAEIIQDYASRDARIFYLHGQHQGIAAAANIGLGAVSAPLLARIDADDIASPIRLQVQYDFMQSHPDIIAVGSDVMLIDKQGKPLRRRTAPNGWQRIETTLKTRNCMCHPSAMIRTQALRQIGGYRDKFRNSLDYDLWLRLSEIGKIDNIPQDLLFYRRHAAQISASSNAHRQTLYSVAAVTDAFIRRYQPGGDETRFDEQHADDIAYKLAALYHAPVSQTERLCLNRHSIRFLRHVRALSTHARTQLWDAARPHLNLHQLLKARLYALLKILALTPDPQS